MSMPDPLSVPLAREALDYFLAAGYDEVDTAILYQGGKTEVTLGEYFCCEPNRAVYFVYFIGMEFVRGRITSGGGTTVV